MRAFVCNPRDPTQVDAAALAAVNRDDGAGLRVVAPARGPPPRSLSADGAAAPSLRPQWVPGESSQPPPHDPSAPYWMCVPPFMDAFQRRSASLTRIPLLLLLLLLSPLPARAGHRRAQPSVPGPGVGSTPPPESLAMGPAAPLVMLHYAQAQAAATFSYYQAMIGGYAPPSVAMSVVPLPIDVRGTGSDGR